LIKGDFETGICTPRLPILRCSSFGSYKGHGACI
jgi:hypothetical protein